MSSSQAMPSRAARAAIVLGQDLPFWYPLDVVLQPNQTGVLAQIQVDNDADFEWRSVIANSTGLFSVTLTNNYIKRPLMPTPINGENIAGTAQQPGILPVPYRLKRTSIIEGVFNNRVGGQVANVVELVLWGYKKFAQTEKYFLPTVLPYRKAISHVYMPTIDELNALRGKIPYWWPVFDAVIPAQQTGRNKFTVPDGCYATHIVASATHDAPFALQIYDTGRNEMLEADATIVDACHVGTAQQPFWLKKVYKLPANAQIQSRVINLAAVPNTVQVVLCGVRD
jgi:hypothetical protein